MRTLLQLPLFARVLLALLALVQLSLQIWGLVDLSRRENVPGGRKWLWALVIVAGGLVGAIVYHAIGKRAPEQASDFDATPRGERQDKRREAIDRLYDDRDA